MIIRSFFCLVVQFSVVFYISVCPVGLGGYELVGIHELKGGPCWCPCMSDGEMAIYFLADVRLHKSGVRTTYLHDFREKSRV